MPDRFIDKKRFKQLGNNFDSANRETCCHISPFAVTCVLRCVELGEYAVSSKVEIITALKK